MNKQTLDLMALSWIIKRPKKHAGAAYLTIR